LLASVCGGEFDGDCGFFLVPLFDLATGTICRAMSSPLHMGRLITVARNYSTVTIDLKLQ
jgi:hypothetical protein